MERVEQYQIEAGGRTVRLSLRQGWNGVRMALVCVAVVAASWYFGPFGPHPLETWKAGGTSFYWIWTSFFVGASFLGPLMGAYGEDWTVDDKGVRVVRSWGPWQSTRQLRRPPPLALRVNVSSDTGEGTSYGLHFLDASGQEGGFGLGLRSARSVDRLLEILQSRLAVKVDDPRPRR
jgi:hypothetical protein